MQGYIHKVNYYETDKMGIVHHSNYIRFMEEARMQYLDDIGFSMNQIESFGITSPVVSVDCKYKSPSTFGDEIEIEIKLKQYTGVKLTLSYVMRNNSTDEIVAIASSTHCFIDSSGKPIAVRRDIPDLDKKIIELMQK